MLGDWHSEQSGGASCAKVLWQEGPAGPKGPAAGGFKHITSHCQAPGYPPHLSSLVSSPIF